MKHLYYTLKVRILQTLYNLETWVYSEYAHNPQWWNSIIGAAAFVWWLNLC